MVTVLSRWLGRRAPKEYARRPALVLINGLAEQAESWFRNAVVWRGHFDVHTPNLLAYDGPALHRRIASGQPIDVAYLVGQLRLYLEEFIQAPPYHLVANSLGGKVAVELTVRHPELVDRLVLLCPSGLGGEERLPVIEGVRRGDVQSIVDSVFFRQPHLDADLVAYYRERFTDRRWRMGLLRTIRGTFNHRVREHLQHVAAPTLLVVGQEDRIVDPQDAITAAPLLPNGRLVVLPQCGHAPQVERAQLVNRMVMEFLKEG